MRVLIPRDCQAGVCAPVRVGCFLESGWQKLQKVMLVFGKFCAETGQFVLKYVQAVHNYINFTIFMLTTAHWRCIVTQYNAIRKENYNVYHS